MKTGSAPCPGKLIWKIIVKGQICLFFTVTFIDSHCQLANFGLTCMYYSLKGPYDECLTLDEIFVCQFFIYFIPKVY